MAARIRAARAGVLGVFYVVLAASVAAQQKPGTLGGTVYNPQEQPQGEILVVISRHAGSQVEKREATSDARGGYRFENLAPGEYYVEVELPRLSPLLASSYHKDIYVGPGARVIADIRLQPIATIRGTVADPAGRFIFDADPTLKDVTGKRWPRLKDDTDASRLSYRYSVPPGRYFLTVRYGAFDPLVMPLTVSQGSSEGFDAKLQYNVRETLNVNDTYGDGARGASFSHGTIDAMFLPSGRTAQSLLSLVPGVVFTDSVGTLAQFTAAGQRRYANRMTVDGLSADLGIDVRGLGIGEAGSGALPATASSGGTQTLVPLAAVERIDIKTTGTAPDLARTPGAQTGIVTRAGGDTLSGGVFADIRPRALGADDWFHGGAAEKLASSFADGGGSLGGRLVPQRLFFFGALEGQRMNRPVDAVVQVPSIGARNAAAAPARALMNAWPLPNGVESGPGLALLAARFPVASSLSTVSLRLDATLSARHRLFARGNAGRSEGDAVGSGRHLPDFTFSHRERTRTQTLSAGLTSVLGSALVNELLGNVSAHDGSLDAGPAGGALLSPELSAADPSGAWMRVNLFAGPGGVLISGPTGGASQRQFQIADKLSWQRGRHTFRAGGSLTRVLAESPAAQRITYSFTNPAQLLQGRTRSVMMESVAGSRALFLSGAAFLQDSFALTRRLTVTYGLRHSVSPAPVSRTGLKPSVIAVESLPALIPRDGDNHLWRTSWTDVAPQLGAAWLLRADANSQTKLSGAVDRVYDELTSPGAAAFGRGAPFVSRRILNATAFPVPDLGAAVPFTDADEHYAYSRDLRRPRIWRWHASLDRALGRGQRASLAYAGTAGRDLVYWRTFYGGPRASQPIQAYSNEGQSSYNALLAEFTRTLSRGMQARVSYTWSHALDTDSGEPPVGHAPASVTPLEGERGPSDYDRRHVLRATASFTMPSLTAKLLSPLGNWRLDVAGTLQSGAPFSVTTLVSQGGGSYVLRPDVVPGVPLWLDDTASPGGRRLNPEAFTAPVGLRQGTLGRNSLHAAPLRQIDMALSRAVRLNGRATAQFRLEAFNVFNLPNFGMPNANLQTSDFGRAYQSHAEALGTGTLSQGGLAPVQQAGGPRALQLGMRVTW